MLNSKGERELAYLVKIDNIIPIEGADRVETAAVGGWKIMVRKNQFHIGDIAVYFEIDSKVPEVEPFMFLESKHFKVKTQKYFKGKVISQGLLMSLDDFIINGEVPAWVIDTKYRIKKGKNVEHEFLTSLLGVTYAVEEDNKRKASSVDKYKKMSQRHPQIFRQPWARWMMKRKWGRKVMFFFFGKKKDKKNVFPTHFPYVKKSDEERIENMPFILEDKEPWIKTLKVDGTSSTYILERKKFKKNEFYVCSRNIRQVTEDQACYHKENVYWINEHQYHIRDFLEAQLKEHPTWSYVCLQGESAGEGIQGNPHKLKGIQFFGFNFIDSEHGRWNSVEAAELCKKYDIPWVPILDTHYILPDTMEEMKVTADGPCDIEGSSGLREGFVYRSLDGVRSFKNVSREYLLKH